jgi:polysaccharide biosynthesis/export protein
MRTFVATVLALALLGQGVAMGQAQPGPSGTQRPKPTAPATQPATKPAPPDAGVPVEPGFTIGPEDVLGILVWKEQDVTGDVTVRPDGMITLPLIRDVKAAGLTPNQLADRIQEALREFITDASVTVVVRQMNSRKVFITGEVVRPGAYSLQGQMTVLQLIALAGGLTEWASQKNITVVRPDSGGGVRPAGQPITFRFNYKEVTERKNLKQNIELRPGDTVIVPEG